MLSYKLNKFIPIFPKLHLSFLGEDQGEEALISFPHQTENFGLSQQKQTGCQSYRNNVFKVGEGGVILKE